MCRTSWKGAGRLTVHDSLIVRRGVPASRGCCREGAGDVRGFSAFSTMEAKPSHHPLRVLPLLVSVVLALMPRAGSQAAEVPGGVWKVGAPIVSYWAGPGFPNGGDLTEAAATQMAEGGWNLGHWRHHQRNITEDFKKAFEENPGGLIALGLMTDTDNTKSEVQAIYGDIEFKSNKR